MSEVFELILSSSGKAAIARPDAGQASHKGKPQAQPRQAARSFETVFSLAPSFVALCQPGVGVDMLLLLSPTKTLDYDEPQPAKPAATIPRFTSQINELAGLLREHTVGGLKKLLNVSDNLAKLNHDRAQRFEQYPTSGSGRTLIEVDPENGFKSAVYAYTGDAFRALEPKTMSVVEIERLNDQLRIISGLYGLLQPMDIIQPYRLCMGDKLAVGGNKNLVVSGACTAHR